MSACVLVRIGQNWADCNNTVNKVTPVSMSYTNHLVKRKIGPGNKTTKGRAPDTR